MNWKPDDDRRHCKRYFQKQPIMIYTHNGSDTCHYGLAYNHCKKGMYLETDAELEIGKYCTIRRLSHYDDDKGPEPYMEHYGSIRWSNAGDESTESVESEYPHGYGLEYA